MKQSSIEWLIEQLQAPCRGIPSHIIEQAKAMHKEEIMDAHLDAYIYMNMSFRGADRAEEYYNETFNTKEK